MAGLFAALLGGKRKRRAGMDVAGPPVASMVLIGGISGRGARWRDTGAKKRRTGRKTAVSR